MRATSKTLTGEYEVAFRDIELGISMGAVANYGSQWLQAIPRTGFEPATPTSRTADEPSEDNDLGSLE
jgi:hypothetical protein